MFLAQFDLATYGLTLRRPEADQKTGYATSATGLTRFATARASFTAVKKSHLINACFDGVYPGYAFGPATLLHATVALPQNPLEHAKPPSDSPSL